MPGRQLPWLAVLWLGVSGNPVMADTPAGPNGKPEAVVVAPVFENSLGMKFVQVPAGSFLMGSEDNAARLIRDYPQYDMQRFAGFIADELPVHQVRITRPFFLGQHEVTVGQFRRFIAASGHVPESEADQTGGYGYNPAHDPAKPENKDAFEGRDRRYSWKNPGFPQGEDHPVLNVTWHDAVAMAKWLSQQEGRTYRLPTEAEWEYACRAGTRTLHPLGDDPQALIRIANIFDADAAPYWKNWQQNALKGHDGYAFTAPVGQFAPNAFGIHDMLGNAWEWVSDWHDDRYYARSPAADPQGPEYGSVKVRRGGSWHTWSLYTRCGFRNWNTPETRYALVGMRLLLEAGPDGKPASRH